MMILSPAFGLMELITYIELYFEKGNSLKFTTLVRELESASILTQNKVYEFIVYL
jgi:hypothetical protein